MLEEKIDRHTKIDLTRNDGVLYAAVGGKTIEGALVVDTLAPPAE